MRWFALVLARTSAQGLAFAAMEIDMVSTAPGKPGWLEFRIRGDDRLRLLVKLARRGDRWVPTRMILDGEWLDAQTLRAIPFGRVESVANRFKADAAGLTVGLPDDARTELAERGEIWPDQFEQIDQALGRYLQESEDDLRNGMQFKRSGPERPPLTRPDGTDPEAFSQRVAEAYNAAIMSTSTPAKMLAEEAGVPVTTVHRWIREARQRGALPPARKGRAG